MEPIACSEIICIRKACSPLFSNGGKCHGACCSQWVPTTHGSPAADNVGICADNGKRLMIDRSAP